MSVEQLSRTLSNISESSSIAATLLTKHTSTPLSKNGWVISSSLCMICRIEFGFFYRPHHCRCCGIIVCDPCSKSKVIIEELKDKGELRICNQCYWGQVSILFN